MCFHHRSAGAVKRERRKASFSVPSKAVEAPPSKTDWVVVDFGSRGFRCERCGALETVTASIVSRVDSFAMRGEAFRLEHEGCAP